MYFFLNPQSNELHLQNTHLGQSSVALSDVMQMNEIINDKHMKQSLGNES
jgi:hypothetical protein